VRARDVVVSESKLRPPVARKEWVPRARLLSSLIDGAEKKLVLVEATVGYGKTILLAQWAHDQLDEARPFAWVTLDSGDNDQTRLWAHIVEAFRPIEPRLSDRMDRLLAEEPDHVTDVLVPRFIKELAVLPGRSVLVLDDFHHIRDRACQGSVARFIEDLPQTVQVVIATRSDAPPELRRARSNGEVLQIRAPDLRFTREEVQELLKVSVDNLLGPQEISHLMERTEGWPAGLYLAALSLRDRSDATEFVEAFAGDNRLVVDYLTMEVLDKQPPPLRRFLVRTSILSRLTPSACDAVVGTEGSAELLDHLVASNLFVVPVDARRRWYRYHRLFQDLLRSELQRSEPQLIPELHRRASAWHRKWGILDEAIAHAKESGDVPTVRELIASNWFRYWEAGRLEDVRSWLDAVRDERIDSDAILALVAAWTAGLLGETDEFEARLKAAQQGTHDGPLPDGFSSLESGIALIRSLFVVDGVRAALADAQRAMGHEKPGSRWRPLALSSLGYLLYLSGSSSEAIPRLGELAKESESDLAIFALARLSIVAVEQGRLQDAEKALTDAEAQMQELTLRADWNEAAVHLARGLIGLEVGDRAAAGIEFERALDVSRRSSRFQPWLSLEALLALARARAELGNGYGAEDLLEEARHILASNPDAGILKERFHNLAAWVASGHGPMDAPLTDREATVLELLPSRLTQREIGDELFLSINTVKSHTRAIFRKLGVESRAEAVAKARNLGLI
jgi:LuxR family transcriptional regulator, maltose regulon positive regulatory protein